MWHSPGNALWQQPGSPCEVTPRLWHEECPAASSPFPSRLFESSGPRTLFAPTHPGGRQHRRRCPAVSGRSCLPSTVPASSTQDLERPAPLRAVAYMPGRTLTRSPPSRPPPGPSLAARAFPAVAPGPSTPRVSRRTSTPSPPPGPQLAANACPAAVLGPTTGPLNSGPRVPCTLRTTAYTSGRFHRRRRVGCRPARGRPPAPPPPLCPASSTSDLECAPCGGCPSSLSSSDLVRPHRRLFTYAPGPPHGVVLLLLRMAARAFLAAAPAPSTPDLACLRWRFSFPRSRAYHGRSCTHPPLLPTFHGPSARAALHLSFSLHHVLLCFRGLVTLVLTRACPC